MTYDGHAKLLDFGVAKMQTASVKTETDVLKGKPRYMAPEHLSGIEVDRRADVFSAGIVLWEAVSGQRMWAGKNDMAVMYAVGGGKIPRIEAAAPSTPPELVRIIDRALSPARENRYPTALALQEDLEAYLRKTSDVVRPRDVGRVLVGHFVGDRAQISAAVEMQLRALANESTRFRLVSIPEIETGVLGAAEVSDSRLHPLSNPPTVIPAALHPPPRRSVWPYVAAAALVVAAAGSAYRLFPRGASGDPLAELRQRLATAWAERQAPDDAASPSAMTASSGLAPRAASPAAPSLGEISPPAPLVKLTFRAAPTEAELFLDGRPLPTNPFSGEFPKTGATHVLRAEAPGFSTLVEPLTFARDAMLDLTLQKVDKVDKVDPRALSAEKPLPLPAASPPVASSPPAAAAPTPPASPAVPTAAHPAAAPAKKAPVDPSNPYDE